MFTLITTDDKKTFDNLDEAVQALLDVIKVNGKYDFTQNEKYMSSKIVYETDEDTRVVTCPGGDWEKARGTPWKKDTVWKVPEVLVHITEKTTPLNQLMAKFRGNPQEAEIEELASYYLSERVDPNKCDDYYQEIKLDTSDFTTWQVQYQTYLNIHYPKKYVPFPPGVGATCPVEFW